MLWIIIPAILSAAVAGLFFFFKKGSSTQTEEPDLRNLGTGAVGCLLLAIDLALSNGEWFQTYLIFWQKLRK
jgi:hypothetical protein